MDLEKIKKLQAQATANKGGRKGFSKPARTGAATNADSDKKLSLALKKLSVQPIQGIEEVNLFHESGKVLNFAAPKVHAAIPSNTYAVYGHGVEKDMTELVPGILNQLGPDNLASLKKMAESYQGARGGFGGQKDQEPDDDDVPDLVESFDVADDSATKGDTEPAASSSNKLEELE